MADVSVEQDWRGWSSRSTSFIQTGEQRTAHAQSGKRGGQRNQIQPKSIWEKTAMNLPLDSQQFFLPDEARTLRTDEAVAQKPLFTSLSRIRIRFSRRGTIRQQR